MKRGGLCLRVRLIKVEHFNDDHFYEVARYLTAQKCTALETVRQYACHSLATCTCTAVRVWY